MITKSVARVALLSLLVTLAGCSTPATTPSGFADTVASLIAVAPQMERATWTSNGTTVPASVMWTNLTVTGESSRSADFYSPYVVGPDDADGSGPDQVVYLGYGSTTDEPFAMAVYARVFATPDSAAAWEAKNEANRASVEGAAPGLDVTTSAGVAVTIFNGGTSVGASAFAVKSNVVVCATLVTRDTGLGVTDLVAVIDPIVAVV